MTNKNYYPMGSYHQSVKLKSKQYALNVLYKAQRAFTLLELLLVIAIIAVLAGIITFALRPAENIQSTQDVRTQSNANDIEKALDLYALDNNGSLPTVFNSYASGYYDICNPDGSKTGCIDLELLKTDQYLSQIPIDSVNATSEVTGYKINYDANNQKAYVDTYSQYRDWAEANGETLTEGLVGYWKMDENSWNGTTGEVVDSSGNGNHANRIGAATTTVGKFGKGGSLNVSNYVEVPDDNSLDGASVSALTVSVWIYFDYPNRVNQNQRLIQKLDSFYFGVDWNYRVHYVNFKNNVNSNCTLNTSSLSNFSMQTWEHFVMTMDASGNYKMYNNGQLNSSGTCNNWDSLYDDTNPLQIGSSLNDTTIYDEVRYYNRALNETEVQALYEYKPSPIAHWKFDEISGASAYDSTGNEHQGTLLNGPTRVKGKYGKAMNFDGTDDYILTDIDFSSTQNITYTGWFKWDGADSFRIFFGTESSSNGTLRIVPLGSVARFGAYWETASNGQTDSNFPILPDTWYFLSIVKIPNKLSFYLDGNLEWEPTVNDVGLNNILIGKQGPHTRYWSGLLDEIKIYDYALTQEQIIEDMNNN